VNDFADFMGYLLTYKKPGDQVTILVIREAETLEFELTLEKRP
jgi:S1-C subfamily serine protease